jgi:mannose-6-phosphate isomerase-like protein (cupin superfamily)
MTTGKVDKGWGVEIIWANNELYCAKLLCFKAPGAKMSMHFHAKKTETWFINTGQFIVRWIDTETATQHEKVLVPGSTWHNPPYQPHQLEAMLPESIVFEVSTEDNSNDNFRVQPGDSQKL